MGPCAVSCSFLISCGFTESVLVGFLIGNVAPLRAQPTTLNSVCICVCMCLYSVPQQFCCGLDDPHNKRPHWLRVGGGSWSVFGQAHWKRWSDRLHKQVFSSSSSPLSSSCRGGILPPPNKLLLPRIPLSPGLLLHFGDITKELAQSFQLVFNICPFYETWWGLVLVSSAEVFSSL